MEIEIPSKSEKEMQPYKLNTIELARLHKKHCQEEDALPSLFVLRLMAEQCGVVFTSKEKEEFI